MKLKDKFALITGSSRGIGRGIAFKLAEQGAKVAVHYYKNSQAAEETLAGIKERGSSGFIVQADVLELGEVHRMLEAVKEKFGKLDVFVSNARPELPDFFQPPLEITVENWQKAINSQATTFLVAVQRIAQFMRDNGRILAITYAPGSRTGGLQPWVAMGSAKAAMESLVRYFAVSLANRGITVNAISPGWIEDSVLNSLPDELQNLIRNWHKQGWTPVRRLGTPADVGNVVSLMCSEEAALITGQIIYADGGSSLMNPEVPTEIQVG
jgi:enoyl-[acyl-carrier protein] reductase III